MEDDDDDVSFDEDVILNSSITEGAVTRALYGDEEGVVSYKCYCLFIVHNYCLII